MIWTKEYRLEQQRLRRKQNKNKDIHIYEKTYKGFLVRLYRNMKSRIEGVQKAKFHLYKEKELFDKEEFYTWALEQPAFYELFEAYKQANYDRKLAPSVDRIDSTKGYLFDNIEWITHSENSRRGAISRWQHTL